MNKKETAEFEALKIQLVQAKAFRFTPPVKPIDIEFKRLNLAGYDSVYSAWGFNSYNSTVFNGCFGRLGHSIYQCSKTTSQGVGGPWFDTEKMALTALRNALESKFSKQLAEIDLRIEGLAP